MVSLVVLEWFFKKNNKFETVDYEIILLDIF